MRDDKIKNEFLLWKNYKRDNKIKKYILVVEKLYLTNLGEAEMKITQRIVFDHLFLQDGHLT